MGLMRNKPTEAGDFESTTNMRRQQVPTSGVHSLWCTHSVRAICYCTSGHSMVVIWHSYALYIRDPSTYQARGYIAETSSVMPALA